MKRFLWLILAVAYVGRAWAGEALAELVVQCGAAGEVTQRVLFRGQEVVAPSPVGLEVDGVALGANDRELSRQTGETGERIELQHASGRRWWIETRRFAGGVALRYGVAAEGPMTVARERTAWQLPVQTRAWYASGIFQYGYMQRFQEREVETLGGEILAPPATFRLPSGVYLALTEANLRHFHGAVLEGLGEGRVGVLFAECKGALETGKAVGMPQHDLNGVVRNHPWTVAPLPGAREVVTPWRVVMLAGDLNGLANNRLVEALADRPDPKLFPAGGREAWIRPGRALWTWLAARPNRLGYDTFFALADEAAALGYEAIVLDEGWEKWPQSEAENPRAAGLDLWGMLAKLCAYAKAKGVDVWVWRPCAPRYPGDLEVLDPAERQRFFDGCAKAGVRGLKLDFFHRENLPTVEAMEALLTAAAERQLMVVFHGVNKPTGDSVTFPNLMAKEAVSGLECVGWGEGMMAPWPVHDATLPFTRWLAGPADYTPLNFRNACPQAVTFAHQVATLVAFTSPMLILAADSEDLLNSPVRPLYEALPVVWDELRILPPSEIGRLAIVARRKGEAWWVAVLNGEAARPDFALALDFLPAGRWQVTAVEDVAHREMTVREQQVAVPGEALALPLLPGGGALLRFEPTRGE